MAATSNGSYAGGQVSRIALAATTATALPTTPYPGRTSIAISNNDTAAIFVGFTSAVTNTTGFQIAAGASLTMALASDQNVYGYSVAGTAAATSIHVLEVR